MASGISPTTLGAGLVLAIGLAACSEPELILTGERLSLRPGVAETGTEDVAAPITLPAQVSRADWTHKAGAPDHAAPHAAFTGNPTLIWSAPIGQGDDKRHRISADPVVANGRVFTVDSRARVQATSLNGAALWSADLTPPGEDPDDASGAGLAVAAGRLFVSTGFGDLHALDPASGARLWTQELDASAAGAPTVAGDLVYIVSRDARGWAVDVEDGRVRWTLQGLPSQSGVVGGAAPAVSDRAVIFPFSSRELRAALREGGTELWRETVAGTRLGQVYASISDISGDPVIVGDRIYAGSPTGRIAALDLASGEQIWSATDGAMSPVVVAGNAVFSVTDRAELVRLDRETGARVWGTELPFFTNRRVARREGVFAHYGPVLAGGRLWVASTDGQLRGFDPVSGALQASVPLPGGATSNPVVAGGVMYVVGTDGRLLAFR